MTLGKIIATYRKEKKISLRSFAERANLSHSYISALEKEIDPRSKKLLTPTYDAIKKIAKAMGMETNELINILDDNQPIIINSNSNYKKLLNEVDKIEILEYLLKEEKIIPQNKTLSSNEKDNFWKFINNNKNILFK